MSDRGRWLVPLLLVVAVACALRLTGLGFLLPHQADPDGFVLEDEVALLKSGDPEFRRHHNTGLYPQLIPRIAAMVPVPGEHDAPPRGLSEHLARASALRLHIRRIIALLSVLVVPATFFLARRFLPTAWALVAAALMSASILHIWFAQQTRPHAAAASLFLLAVVSFLRLRRKPEPGAYLLAGLCMALAIGSLQSGVAVLPPFLAAVLLRDRAGPRRSSLSHAGWALVARAIAASVLFLFYPFLFGDSPTAAPIRLSASGEEVSLTAHRVLLRLFNGNGFARIAKAARDYDPLLSGLALAGAGLGAWRALRGWRHLGPERGRDLAVALAYAVPYGLAIGMYQLSHQRFLVPLMPFAACLAAFLVMTLSQPLAERIRSPLTRRLAVGALVALPLGAQGFAALKLAAVRAAPDTITRAAAWIRENARSGSDRVLVLPTIDLPLLQTEAALRANEPAALALRYLRWYPYLAQAQGEQPAAELYDLRFIPMRTPESVEALLRDPAAYLDALEGDFAVIEAGYEGWALPQFGVVRTTLRESARLVATFSPDRTGYWDQPLGAQENWLRPSLPWAWRVVHAECTGPLVEIYDLRRR